MSAKIDVSSAVLAPSQSMTQFVLQQLLAGLNVRVTIGEKVYDGYVHNLDFARGADHVFASVCVSEPELGEYEGAGGFPSIKVAIHLNGTVQVLPPHVEE